MKKGFKAASIAFYFLMFVVFFFIGIYAAGIFGAGKGQMLAGGAIVLGWGVLFAISAFLASFFIVYYVQHKSIVRLNLILLVLLMVLYGITHYRYLERQKEKAKDNNKPKTEQQKKQKTSPVSVLPTVLHFTKNAPNKNTSDIKNETVNTAGSKLGIGFFSPNYFENPTLYFYGGVNLEKGLTDHTATDSVVFTRDQHNNPTTSYAPPWLYPEHLKLDYGIVVFKVLGMGNDFVKVEANKQNGQITYLDKYMGKFVSWAEFLVSVNSVEFNENSTSVD